MSHVVKSEVYDEFKQYAIENMRDTNRKLNVCAFDEMDEATDTHLKLRIKNMVEVKEDLFKKVREYMPGAVLKSYKDISTGNHGYMALIPWRASRGGSGPTNSTRKPSTVKLIFWTTILVGTITTAMFTTTLEQWLLYNPF